MVLSSFLSLVVGVLIRYWLSNSTISEWLGEKNEVVTPLTSWKRATEGFALHNVGVSPYSGDVFHEMPLLLWVLNFFNTVCGDYIHFLFIVVDVITALTLERIAQYSGRYLLTVEQLNKNSKYSPESSKLLVRADELYISAHAVVAIYMLNPYSIASCLAKSTAVFNNLFLAMAMLYTLQRCRIRASIHIALAAYVSMYPIMLIVPSSLFIAQWQSPDCSVKKLVVSLLKTSICTGVVLTTLLYISFVTTNSWNFIYGTYGFILTVPDLTPNIGVFWYFFTEMFEHFRLFFICVFQINAFIYTVPLAIRLRDHPIFMMYTLIAIMAVFKSYPSYADVAMYISMLPLWRHIFPYMRNTFIVSCMFVVCTVLAPILWHLWIYAGSANANFYFAITLTFSTAQVFLVTDLLFAFLRREYDLVNGTKPPIIDGAPAQVVLE